MLGITFGYLILALIFLSIIVAMISRINAPIAGVIGSVGYIFLWGWWMSGFFVNYSGYVGRRRQRPVYGPPPAPPSGYSY